MRGSEKIRQVIYIDMTAYKKRISSSKKITRVAGACLFTRHHGLSPPIHPADAAAICLPIGGSSISVYSSVI